MGTTGTEDKGCSVSELLPIKIIKQSSSLQPRAKMDTRIIDEYTEAMKGGAAFPAVIVYKVGEDYYLVDGYHRYLAVQGAKFDKILAEVRTGTMREAILQSAGVNATHGLNRTIEDKRRAAAILLKDPEWGKWADTKIASICYVSIDLVANVRKSILGETDSTTPVRKYERNGKTLKMDTSKIGKKPIKQDPAKCFSPQPGSIKVTNDPPIKSLAEITRQKEMQEAAANQHIDSTSVNLPQDIPANTTLEILTAPPDAQPVAPVPHKAPCLCNQPCPPGGKQVIPEPKSIHGIRCSVNMHSIKQLFRDECPIEAAARLKGSPVEAFRTADKLNGARPITNDLRPLQRHPVQMEIFWKPSPKMQSFLERIMKAQGLDTPAEALDEIVSRAMEAE